ncbi:hypothetical protein AB4Y44_09930 [Paraburkholderia sp. BR10937]|uniref:hypothetical protein n=1 Tax=Paraburkholderia sp. BR10937 TaxID=3236994 RepID=UPI0034D155A1
MKSQPSKAKGKENATRLQIWIRETPTEKVPVNQFGKAARQKICAELGIARSTVSSNATIRILFDELDMAISGIKSADNEILSSGSRAAQKNVVIALLASNSKFVSERASLKARMERLSYLEDTGGLLHVLLGPEN